MGPDSPEAIESEFHCLFARSLQSSVGALIVDSPEVCDSSCLSDSANLKPLSASNIWVGSQMRGLEPEALLRTLLSPGAVHRAIAWRMNLWCSWCAGMVRC